MNDICPKYLLSDKECVVRIQKGEFDAFKFLYERYKQSVYRYIRLKCNESETAKDITSEVFSKVISNIDRLCEPYNFKNWLYTIVNHEIANFRRKINASKVVLQADIETNKSEQEFEEPYTQLPEKLNNSLIENVQEITRCLSPTEQQIFALNIEAGYTIKEISEMLNKKESAVKMIVLRAKKKFIKSYLQKYKSPVYLRGEKK